MKLKQTGIRVNATQKPRAHARASISARVDGQRDVNTFFFRKYDIPYPTFVLYANRVHNMLGPSADGGAGEC
jgi:hypothetical protein